MLQLLWQLKLSWDDEVDDSIKTQYFRLAEEVHDLNRIHLPRSLTPALPQGPPEIHGFSDGGEQAYGAIIWLRWPAKEHRILRFVAAKSYVAPLKKKSISRLELMGTVILARLLISVIKVVATSKIFLWTDSPTVLYWLRLPANSFKPFVSTRIQEIQDSVPDALTCFRFVQSNLNPAYALTKPLHASKLSSWLEGPQFLLKTEENWPKQPTELIHDKILSTKELSKNNKTFLNVHRFNLIIDFENLLTKRISSWRPLVRVVAWLKRFMFPQQYKQLNAAELERAKLCLFWVAQSYFRDPSQEKTKEKLNLEIFTDVLRIHGRLNNFFNSESIANPIALPWQSKITRLFAEFMHQFYGHQGYRVVLINLREQGMYILFGEKIYSNLSHQSAFAVELLDETCCNNKWDTYQLSDLRLIALHFHLLH